MLVLGVCGMGGKVCGHLSTPLVKKFKILIWNLNSYDLNIKKYCDD